MVILGTVSIPKKVTCCFKATFSAGIPTQFWMKHTQKWQKRDKVKYLLVFRNGEDT